MCSSVITASYCSETFLTSSIPLYKEKLIKFFNSECPPCSIHRYIVTYQALMQLKLRGSYEPLSSREFLRFTNFMQTVQALSLILRRLIACLNRQAFRDMFK